MTTLTEATGTKLRDMLLRHAAELNALLLALEGELPVEECRAAKSIAGAVMLEIFTEGLDPIFKALPHLKPDGLK